MKRYFIDSNGNIRESASEQFLMHSTGKWDRDKTKYVKIVKSPSGRPAYLYPDDLLPGKRKHTEVTDEMLSMIDVLVDGPFVFEKKNISLAFRGSENQRVINLKETLKQKSIIKYID